MPGRNVYDQERHAHFVTFSCYRRRRLLSAEKPKKIVLGVLGPQLARQEGTCLGFVIMPDHVHALLWFAGDGQLSHFMKLWKQRSSYAIKGWLREFRPQLAERFDLSEPVWQPKYHAFNVYSDRKKREKLEYMHLNPVRAGLVEKTVAWPWSSARHYEQGRSVGVPINWID